MEPISPADQDLSDAIATFQEILTSSTPQKCGPPDSRNTVNIKVTAVLKEGLHRVAAAFNFGSPSSVGRQDAGHLKKMLISLCHRGKDSFFERVGVKKIIQCANGLVARERAPAGKLRTPRGIILERMVHDISRSTSRAYKELQSLPLKDSLLDPQIEVKHPDGQTEKYIQHLQPSHQQL